MYVSMQKKVTMERSLWIKITPEFLELRMQNSRVLFSYQHECLGKVSNLQYCNFSKCSLELTVETLILRLVILLISGWIKAVNSAVSQK